jgi:hypothetical protein
LNYVESKSIIEFAVALSIVAVDCILGNAKHQIIITKFWFWVAKELSTTEAGWRLSVKGDFS